MFTDTAVSQINCTDIRADNAKSNPKNLENDNKSRQIMPQNPNETINAEKIKDSFLFLYFSIPL